MAWIDLGNPSPRLEARAHTPFNWPCLEEIPLEPASGIDTQSITFDELASRRRSRRSFGPLSLVALGD